MTAPELHMLWETVDPAAALAERFGFADAVGAAAWFGETVHDAWALEVERCDRLVLSASRLLAWVTIGGEAFIAKCAVDGSLFAMLAEIDALIAWLGTEGIPVAAPVPAADGRPRVERDRISLALYPVIRGDLLDTGDAQQVATAGRTLATLHTVLAAYPRRLRDVPGEHGQLVHGDFRSANVLQSDGTITAILDFDEACSRSRAWEVGRSAVLLGTRYHDWQPMSPDERAAFVAAYSEVAPLTRDERGDVDDVVAAVLQHFGWS